MHLYETSGIQYFDDDIIIYIQGLCTRNLFWTWSPSLRCFSEFLSSQYSRTPLSENGQSSFCHLSSSNYISIWNYVGKLFSDTHGSCICVGKHEVALLAVLRLSISAWNTEKQNQYQDSLWVGCLICLPTVLFLVYYYSVSLLWVYFLLFLPYYPLQYWSGRSISDL
jgi:hypothetical protein